MKAVITPATEVEYDFILHYRRSSPFKCGQEIPNGTRDDNGMTVRFRGKCLVQAITEEQSSAKIKDVTVYAKIYNPIE